MGIFPVSSNASDECVHYLWQFIAHDSENSSEILKRQRAVELTTSNTYTDEFVTTEISIFLPTTDLRVSFNASLSTIASHTSDEFVHYCWQSVSDDGKNTLESINTALCGPQGARVKERERERERQRERGRDCVYALMHHCIDRKVRERQWTVRPFALGLIRSRMCC